jgi:elongation factor P
MAVLAGEVKVGNIIAYEGGKYRILKRTHVKPGKGGAFYQMEMKEITIGTKRNERIRSEDKLEKLETSAREFSFSYRDGETIVIMDGETFETLEIPVEMLNGFDMFLEDGMKLIAEYVGDDLVNVKMPQKLVGEVGETEPHIKNAAVSPSYKEAKLTNGFVLDIPPYIEQGTKIVVSSETGEFVEKFK